MPKVVYVEPDDEITDLVDRIRGTEEEGDLVFVLPHQSRVLQSPLNLRLLQQYSRSFVRRTAIITGDPRVQGMARDAGFPTYASVQAYERGVEVVRPHPASEDGDGMPPIGHLAQALPAAAAAAMAAEERRAAPPTAVAAPPRPMPEPGGPPNRRPYYYAAAALFVIGLLLLFLVAPSAKVTITLAATPVQVNPAVQGTSDPAAATSPDHVHTSVVTAQESQTFKATPHGSRTIPAAAATTSVVFTNQNPFDVSFHVYKNTEFDTTDNPPVKFVATQDVDVTAPAGGSGPSNPVPVQDQTAEARGNVAANTITVWPSNPCLPQNQPTPPASPYPCGPSDLSVTNPQAATGGVDAKQLVTASAQDVQSWRSQVDQLSKQLSDKVRQDMRDKAGGQTLASDPKGGGTSITVSVSPQLPQADAQWTDTTVTVSAGGKASAYNPADVKKVAQSDLQAKVPPGYMLVAQQTRITEPAVTQATEDGTVAFSVSATGYSQPIIDIEGLKGSLTHQTPGTVRNVVRAKLGSQVQSVDVQQSIPFFVLPFFSSRIEVVEQVVGGTTSP